VVPSRVAISVQEYPNVRSPRVIMQILRHAQFSVTIEIYARASSAATREALKRLGESLNSDAEGQ